LVLVRHARIMLGKAKKKFGNAHTLSAGKNSAVPSLQKLIVEARAAFGGFWPRAEPWVGQSKVRAHPKL
jgi:hypothetical protein